MTAAIRARRTVRLSSRVTAGILGGAAPVFDPATLTLTGWWRGNYSASPWSGTASAGSSGSKSLTEATNAPAAGTAQNGYTPADFDGTNDKLANATAMSSIFTGSAGTFVVLARMDTAAAAAAIPYDDPTFFSDSGVGAVCLGWNSSGVRAYLYDGADKSVTVAQATGSYFLAIMRWDNANLKLRVNSGADSSTAAGTMSNATGTLNIGTNYSAAAFIDGRVLEIMTVASAISDSDCNNIKSYVNSRYSLSL